MGFECLNNAEHLDDIWGGKYCKIFQKFYTYLEQWKENVWTFGQTLTNIYPIVWYSTVIDKAGGFMALKNKHVHAQSCPTLCNSMDCSLPAPLSLEFSRQGYQSVRLFPTPVDIPNPGIEPWLLSLLHWQVGSFPLHHLGSS